MKAQAVTKYFEVLKVNALQQLAYGGELLLRSISMVLFMFVFWWRGCAWCHSSLAYGGIYGFKGKALVDPAPSGL